MATRVVLFAFTVVLASTLVVSALPVPTSPPNDPLPNAGTTDPALVGRWSAPFEGRVPAISMALTGNGDVVYWSGVEARERDNVFFLEGPYDAEVAKLSPPYDASSVSVLATPPDLGDLFCAGQTVLSDGRLLVAGGSLYQELTDPDYQGFVSGLTASWIYDPASDTWSRSGDMNWARWYPTVLTGADGGVVVAGGIDHLAQPHTLVMQVEDWNGATWRDRPATDDNLLPMYPRLFTIPNGDAKGDLFFETSATLWGPFGEHPGEALWNLEQVLEADGGWRIVGPSVFGARQHAATVMLPLSADDGYQARILTFGGSIGRSIAATNLAEITTIENDGGASHQVAAPLAHPRWQANGVLLPDGSVLAVGGGLYDNVYVHGQPVPAVLTAERYDPASDTWTQMADMTVPRIYHSSALLLPDGRVLAGGHVPLPVPWKAFRDNVPGQGQVAETRFEIYEPPYLHWGVARPVITSAPSHVGFGQSFVVGTPDADRVVDAILVRVGATTHAWDSNERAIVLDATPVEGGLRFTAPPDGDVATPGPWMLFLRVQADQGLVPSVAAIVNVS